MGKQLQHYSILLDTLHFWGSLAFFVPGEKPTGKQPALQENTYSSLLFRLLTSARVQCTFSQCLIEKDSIRDPHPVMNLHITQH